MKTKLVALVVLFSISLIGSAYACHSTYHPPPKNTNIVRHSEEPLREPPILGLEYFDGINQYYDDGIYINGKPYAVKHNNHISNIFSYDEQTNMTLKIYMPLGDNKQLQHVELDVGNDFISWDKSNGKTIPKNTHFENVYMVKKTDGYYIYFTFFITPTPRADIDHLKIRMWDERGASNDIILRA